MGLVPHGLGTNRLGVGTIKEPLHAAYPHVLIGQTAGFEELTPRLLSFTFVASSAAGDKIADAMTVSREVALHDAVEYVIPGGCLRLAIDAQQFRIGILTEVPHRLGNCGLAVKVVRGKRRCKRVRKGALALHNG